MKARVTESDVQSIIATYIGAPDMKTNVILELIRAYGDAMLSLGNHAAHCYARPENPAVRRLAERASDEATQLRRDIESAILGLSERAETLADASQETR